jgi:hypothetical protein
MQHTFARQGYSSMMLATVFFPRLFITKINILLSQSKQRRYPLEKA